MIEFDYQRLINVGVQTAENDARFLRNGFVPIVVAHHVEQPKPSIIVGRKGAGKSAMRLHFEHNHSKTNRVFNVQPSAKDLSAVFSYFESAPSWAKNVESNNGIVGGNSTCQYHKINVRRRRLRFAWLRFQICTRTPHC